MKQHRHQLMITYRDSQAMAVLNTAKECGIDVPNEIPSVVV